MENLVEAASKTVDITETEFLTSITLRDITSKGLYEQLAKYRDACTNLIFLDFDAAALKKVETHLWEAHVRFNSKFRPILAQFRDGDGKKKHVERRKTEKLYLDFIKSSMRFYRGFIQRLASHFKDVPEVFVIARKFNLDTLSADVPVEVNMLHKRLIVRSCYATLIHLGDLSRYQETELKQKERNWGPAKGYYDLATALDPTDGQSWNQLAVISLADDDYLRAIYYLYRSLSTPRAPALTSNNLKAAWKSIFKLPQVGAALTGPFRSGCSGDLTTTFLAYHAKCQSDPNFSDPEERELREALIGSFKSCLLTEAFDSSYRKVCLINIATTKHAESYVLQVAETDPASALKYSTIVRRTEALNISTFTMLFELLAEELQGTRAHGVGITPLARRLLPLLRLYNGWLLSDLPRLLETETMNAAAYGWQVDKVWASYTAALTRLVSNFDILHLSQVPYLLDEDQETIAFTPFSEMVRKLHLEDSTGSLKPNRADYALSESFAPDNEMESRIRALVQIGVHLNKHKDEFSHISIPIRFAGQQFHFDRGAASLTCHAEPSSVQPDEPTPMSVESMVNNLVGPNHNLPGSPHSSRPQPPLSPISKPASRPASSGFTVQDLVRQMQRSPPTGAAGINGHPSQPTPLPGIWQTPFTPRPGEDLGAGLGPRPGTAHSPVPPPTNVFPPSTGAIEFQQQITQNNQVRTSPAVPFEPTQSPCYQTPSRFHTFLRHQPNQSPWDSSLATSSAPIIGTGQSNTSNASPFGAIGERQRSAKTPTSAQPG